MSPEPPRNPRPEPRNPAGTPSMTGTNRFRRWEMLGLGGLVLILGVPVAGILLLRACEYPGGMRSDYPARDFDPRLTRIARTALPIMEALERYHGKTGSYPASLTELRAYLPVGAEINEAINMAYLPVGVKMKEAGNGFMSWHYERLDPGYCIASKLGWDSALYYDSQADQWIFHRGDGTPNVPIILQLDKPGQAVKRPSDPKSEK